MKIKSPVLRRFMRRKLSVVAACVLFVFVLAAIFGPSLCKYDPMKQDLLNRFKGISANNWLGTDNLGRDTFTRMIYGAKISLTISFFGVMMGTFIGVLLGVFAGFYGKWVDAIISRFIDVLLAFPGLFLAIIIVAILGNGTINTIVAVCVFSIPTMARITRSTVVSLRNSEYVQACRVMGASDLRIIFTHIIPNSISLIIVTVTLNLGTSILTASSLSFLGLGVTPPNPEWGAMLSQARDVMRNDPRSVLVPGIAITLVVMCFSLVGDGLRDALDPKLKNN